MASIGFSPPHHLSDHLGELVRAPGPQHEPCGPAPGASLEVQLHPPVPPTFENSLKDAYRQHARSAGGTLPQAREEEESPQDERPTEGHVESGNLPENQQSQERGEEGFTENRR